MIKLTKGSRLDELPPDNPEGTYRLAKNMVNYKRFGSLSNEPGADDITPVAIPTTIYENFPTKPVNGIIPITKGSVFFFAPSNVGNDSEIGIVDELNRYHPILRDVTGKVILNFDINFPIQGTFEYKFNQNLIIAWTDANQNPCILNVDCLPFTLDSDYTVTIADFEKAKSLIKVFPNVLAPEVTDLFLSDNGGALQTGSYYPIVSYELSDKSVTSWLKVYNPFPVVQDSSTIVFKDYDGDFPKTSTSKKLHIKFENIDTNYLNLRFGVIILQAGQYNAYYISSFKINGSTLEFDYTGSESTTIPITLDEVLIPNAVYDKVETVTNLLGKLYFGGVEKKSSIDFQKYANMIKVKWVQGDVLGLTNNTQSSYKNEKRVFFDKSFRSNEVMALYIAGRYKDGSMTEAFHIPGRAPLPGDTDLLSGIGVPDIDYLDNDVKNFQISETALMDGTMGYWENNSEVYPNTDEFNSTSLGGLDLRNLPVRHHKFPEINLFTSHGQNYFNFGDIQSGQLILNNDNYINVEYTIVDFPYTVVSNTTSNLITTIPGDFISIKATSDNTIVKVSGGFGYYFALEDPDPSGYVGVIFLDYPNNTFDHSVYGAGSHGGGSATVTKYVLLETANVSELRLTMRGRVGSQNDNDPSSIVSQLTLTSSVVSNIAKPLGIEISNLNIPPEIADQIDSWEIFYAKRDTSNIRMIGQDIMIEERFHTFDLVYNQANLKGSYLKPQIKYFNLTNDFLTQGFETPGNLYPIQNGRAIRAIESFLYLGENVLLPIDNTNKATNLYIKLQGETVADTQANNPTMFWDICIYRKDMYKTFDAQTLVSTGKAFKILNAGIQPVVNVFGGDTFISAFGFIENITDKNEYLLPQESAANIGLRMDDETQTPSKYYYPKHTKLDTIKPVISYYGYNNDYTALNILNKVFPKSAAFDNCTSNIFQFPWLIAYSLNDANESLKLNWRIFKINDYYDQLPKDKGKLWNLLGSNRTLYIQLEYALLIAEVKDKLGVSEEEVNLGVSDIFDRPPVEIVQDKDGYVGSQCKFATIMTPIGYVTVDRQRGKIFVVNDGKLSEISNTGYYNFFKDNLQTDNIDIDNPFIGNGYTASYDSEFRRLLIVKKSSINEMTLSYSSDGNHWVSFHDYHPNYMFTTRNGLYAGVNNNFKLYKHNSKTLKGIFYNAVMFDSYVDVPFNQKEDVTKVFGNFNWITHVIDANSVTRDDETLTGLMVYNTNQCSGINQLQADSGIWFGKDARNTEETWNYNKFRDLLKDRNLPFIDSNGNLITSNIDPNKPWFDKNKFITKFVIVRFIYNNVNQRDLHIVSVNSNMRPSKR